MRSCLETTDFSKKPALPLLTSLRFFAALDVIFYHRAPPQSPGFIANLSASGYDAVSFFFILSGFVLAYAYKTPLGSKESTSSIVKFWWARFSRIIPAFVLSLLLSGPIFIYSGIISRVTPLDECLLGLVLVPLLAQAWWPPAALLWNGPAWSLSVEAFFYGVFPWLVRRTSTWPALRWVIVSMTFVVGSEFIRCLIMRVDGDNVFHRNLVFYWPPLHLPAFILGMSLTRLLLTCNPRARVACGWLFPAGAILTIFILGCRSWLPSWATSPPIQALAYSTLILGAAAARPTGPLAHKYVVILGEASYAMYILHEAIAFWWDRYIGGIGAKRTWLSFGGFVVAVISGSVMVYLWIEKPCRRRLLGHA